MIFFLILFVHTAWASSPFVAIFVDATTEAKLGRFPIERTYYAKALEQLKSGQARGVVLKYFFDLPRKGDDELVLAMKGIPTLLQARIDNEEPATQKLSPLFFQSDVKGPLKNLITGKKGWIPLPRLQQSAAGVGFVDTRTGLHLNYPVIESYQGKAVPTLVLLTVEMALNEKAAIEVGQAIKWKNLTIPLTPESELKITAKSSLKIYSLADLLDGKIATSELKDKIVILGYTGSKSPKLQTELGTLESHDLFLAAVEDLYQRSK